MIICIIIPPIIHLYTTNTNNINNNNSNNKVWEGPVRDD